MKIDTKFKVGDEVFFMRNIIRQGVISNITILIDFERVVIKYYSPTFGVITNEEETFATREELLNHFFS